MGVFKQRNNVPIILVDKYQETCSFCKLYLNIYRAMTVVDGCTQHPYLGQETASPGQGEMLLSDLRGGSLVLGFERTGES